MKDSSCAPHRFLWRVGRAAVGHITEDPWNQICDIEVIYEFISDAYEGVKGTYRTKEEWCKYLKKEWAKTAHSKRLKAQYKRALATQAAEALRYSGGAR